MALALGMIGTLGRFGLARLYQSALNSGVAAWPTANKAFYFSVEVPLPITIDRMFYIAGGAGTGNIDIAVFNGDTLAKIVSTGATAGVATEGMQKISITETDLNPGVYLLGMSIDSNTFTIHRTAAGATTNPFWGRSETSAHPLPSTATLSAAGADYQPSFGMLCTGCYV